MADYSWMTEISPLSSEKGAFVRPLGEWYIEVLETDLSVDFGDIGGRAPFVVNARVRVIEEDGTQWTGLTRIG